MSAVQPFVSVTSTPARLLSSEQAHGAPVPVLACQHQCRPAIVSMSARWALLVVTDEQCAGARLVLACHYERRSVPGADEVGVGIMAE